MKPEDLYDGVTNIRDDLIDNAKKTKKRKRWPAALAAVLAVAVLAGSVAALAGRRGGSPGGVTPSGREAAALAEARYPDRPRYPEIDDITLEMDEEQFDAWLEALLARQLTQEEWDALAVWERRLVPALLTGAGDGNTVCSPVSVYLALGMLSEITEGTSRQEILDALGADSVEALRAQANRVWNALYNDDGSYTLGLAASVWLRDDTDYVTAPLERLAESYYASSYRGEMGGGDYNGFLQKWLNAHTGGLLEDAANGVDLDADTALALATTVLFKDKWDAGFNPKRTDTGVFHAPAGDTACEFMHNSSDAWYSWSDKFSAVRQDFEYGGTMRLLLPDEGVSVEEILADPAAVSYLTDTVDRDAVGSKYLKVNLSLPKFDVTENGEIGPKLKALGVTEVFDRAKADFSPVMGEDLTPENNVFLSQILHAARVSIDEEGCVGAAYTVAAMSGSAEPPDDEVDITFDRPFLFTVTNNGVPVFAGIVNKP